MTHPYGEWTEATRASRYNERNPHDAEAIREALAPLGLGPEDRFLDLGCGQGFFVLEAAKIVRSALGVDLSPVQIGQCQENAGGAERVRFLQSAFETLELGPERFTRAFSRKALHHLADDAKVEFMRKLGAHMKTGGLFLLEDLIYFPGWEEALAAFREGRTDPDLQVPESIAQGWEGDYPATLAHWRKAFAEGGFQVLAETRISPFYGRMLARKAG